MQAASTLQFGLRQLAGSMTALTIFGACGCQSSVNRSHYLQHLGTVVAPVAEADRQRVLVAFDRWEPPAEPRRAALGGSVAADSPAFRRSLHADALSAYDRVLPPPPMP